MTVDLRAIVATDLGLCISGDVGSNHISDRSGLQMFSGRLTFDGTVTPARGTPISFLVACPQTGKVTRFPHLLRVIRAVAYPLERRSEIEVGCMLTLMKDRKDQAVYSTREYTPPWYENLSVRQKSTVAVPIYAHELLRYCLKKIGLGISLNSYQLKSKFLQREIDLSQGYVQVIGDLVRSESCFGRLRLNETFQVVKINTSIGQKGPILRASNLISIEPISTGAEPPSGYTVKYSAIRRQS